MTDDRAKSPRLVQIVTTPLTAFALLRGQLSYLTRHGFEVVVITGTEPAELVEAVRRREGVEVVTLPLSREIHPLRDAAALLRLVLLLRRLAPEIVNAGTPKAGLLGLTAARIAGVPNRVYTLRGLRLETTRGARRLLLAGAERVASACAHQIVCVSESLRRRYLDLGLGGKKTRVLGDGSSNGIDLELFDSGALDAAATAALRRRLELEDEAPVVGFVGRLTRDKGIEDLVAAFAAVLRRQPRARLLVVGGLERGDPLPTSVAKRLAEDPAILQIGFVEDPRPYYDLMDLLVLPSYREGFPNAVLEAAAAGLPTVGYEVTGTVDAVVSGRTGCLVPRGERARLAEAILAYLEDPDERRRHGRQARERVESSFRSEIVWRGWLGLFQELAGGPRPGAGHEAKPGQ